MKRKILKNISIILLAMTLISSVGVNAATGSPDATQTATYTNALNRLISLGIVSGSAEAFKPYDDLTREQFSRMLVAAAGLESLAESLKGPTVFPDVSSDAWSSGYVKAAVSKGYIAGAADGRFHPTQAITFAQLCTGIVRALGYTDQDLSGTWPGNYVSKAAALGLTDGISLKNNDGVPRWAAAEIVDRLLDAYVKKSSPTAADQTFIEATGNFTPYIILGDSAALDTLTGNQVLTDKGIFGNPSGIKLDLGTKYNLSIINGNITKAGRITSSMTQISVDLVTDNKISYRSNGTDKSMILPDSIPYYYKGVKQDFKNVPGLLQKDTSIVFSNNSNNTGYEFAVIFDPIYSKPEIANSYVSSSKILGSINFGDNPLIIRNGSSIDISQIEEKDIVYQVTDIWNGNKYFTVVDNKIGGIITDILPSKLSPKTIQIAGTNYDISKDMDLSILAGINGSLAVDNNIIISLGHDNKIVNIENFGAEDNSDYALVLNSTYTITPRKDGTKSTVYSVKLLFSNGVTGEYNVPSTDTMQFKGDLVKYKVIDAQTVSIEQVYYNYPGETFINKDERLLGSQYVSDNVKIFNIIYDDTGSEVQAALLKWSDLPGGTIPQGKIWYTNETGLFNDINIILTNDIFDQRYQLGVVKSTTTAPTAKGSSTQYTVDVHGKAYVYDKSLNISGNGYVYKFKMSTSGIDSLDQSMSPFVSGRTVQAIDGRRIKINDKIYFFRPNVSVYYKDFDGIVSSKTLADISSNQSFGRIELYSVGADNKVDVIFITE